MIPVRSFAPVKLASWLSVAILTTLGCSRGAGDAPVAPQPPGPVAGSSVQSLQKSATMALAVEGELAADVTPAFLAQLPSTLATADRDFAAKAMAQAFAQAYLGRVQGTKETACTVDLAGAIRNRCLVEEILATEFADQDAILVAFSQTINNVVNNNGATVNTIISSTVDVDALQSRLDSILGAVGGLHVLLGERLAPLQQSLETLSQLATERLQQVLQVLLHGQSRDNLPWLSADFVEGRQFLMTTSVEQNGRSPSMNNGNVTKNFSALLVDLVVRDGGLLVTHLPDGRGSGGEVGDIVALFPVVATRTDSSGKIYYQIDFAHARNDNFLATNFERSMGNTFLEINKLSHSLKAEVVLPTLAHRQREVLPELGSGNYFNRKDTSLVLDTMVMFQSSTPFLGAEDTDWLMGRNPYRPTARIIVSFVQQSEHNVAFTKNSAANATEAAGRLQDMGIDMRTEGKTMARPFFVGGLPLEGDPGRRQRITAYAARFDLASDQVFAISRNTPAIVVPVLKASVNAWGKAFAALKKDGTTQGRVLAMTEEEFVAAYGDDLRLPEGRLAATDPRVNMISWDDTPGLSVAWTSFLTHPISGELISSDVFLAGKAWAELGCMLYMERQWNGSSAEGLPVPSLDTAIQWFNLCDLQLEKMGLVPEKPIVLPPGMEPIVLPPITPVGDDEPANLALPANYRVALAHRTANSVSHKLGDIDELHNHQPGVTCMRSAPTSPTEYIGLARVGLPKIDMEKIHSVQDAALAMIKAVSTHELGHAFGLRHNFMASTLEGAAETPLPTLSETHSVMDYNEPALDINAGSMNDYTDGDHGADGLAELGAYDMAAIASLYNLDRSKVRVSEKIPFCTDDNGSYLSNCQPHDYGTDYRQFLLYKLNRDMAILRAEGLGKNLNSVDSLKQASAILWWEWSNVIGGLDPLRATGRGDKTKVLQLARLLGRGEIPAIDPENPSATISIEPYLQEFADRYGMPIVGVEELLDPSLDLFRNESEFLRPYDRMIAARVGIEAFTLGLGTAQILNVERAGRASDNRFMTVLHNLKLPDGTEWNVQSDLVTLFRRMAVIPEGAEVALPPFGFGDPNRPPLLAQLMVPFLQHNKNVVMRHEEANIYMLTGNAHMADFELILNALTIVAPGSPYAPSVTALREDRHRVACLAEIADSESCLGITTKVVADAGDTPQYARIQDTLVSDRALLFAQLLVSQYDSAIALASKSIPDLMEILFPDDE